MANTTTDARASTPAPRKPRPTAKNYIRFLSKMRRLHQVTCYIDREEISSALQYGGPSSLNSYLAALDDARAWVDAVKGQIAQAKQGAV